MVYFFHRAGQYYRVENRIVYELEITAPNGAKHVERFADAELLTERERALHDELRTQAGMARTAVPSESADPATWFEIVQPAGRRDAAILWLAHGVPLVWIQLQWGRG